MIQIKLNLLLDKFVINEDVYHYCQELLKRLITEQYIEHENEASVFIIHLAMALMRNLKPNPEVIESLDADLNTQLSNDSKYTEALELWQNIEPKEFCLLHENEHAYLYMHLVTLLNK
jgi:PRD domain